MPVEFRHEWKHELNAMDLLVLRQRLRAVLRPDPHARNGRYEIRSLYFDTPTDRALREKLDGVSCREKYRIRYYDGDTSPLHLEKKSKRGGLGNKQSCSLTREEAQMLVEGQMDWMPDHSQDLVRELYTRMRIQGLRPRTIVDYTREPFVFAPGNVRVTLDYNLRTGLSCVDFLNPACVTIPAGNAPILLEVKWDGFLPDVVRDAIQLPGRRVTSFSKYAQCRIYG